MDIWNPFHNFIKNLVHSDWLGCVGLLHGGALILLVSLNKVKEVFFFRNVCWFMQRKEATVCFDELLTITRPCCTWWKQKSNCNGLIIVRGDNESLCSVYWVNTNSIMYWRSENQIPYTAAQLIQTTEKHGSWPQANNLLDDIYGWCWYFMCGINK